jgi:hypothetical protein
MKARFSLHRAFTEKTCDICLATIPAASAISYAEYWRVKGGRGLNGVTVVCCLCHALFGLPTDGWVRAPENFHCKGIS